MTHQQITSLVLEYDKHGKPTVTQTSEERNFTDIEVRVMLEEINIDHRILFMANTQSVTNKVKGRTWTKITEKVSACGVAVRSPKHVKDKWRSLKGAVLNKQRQRSKIGGGPEETPPV